MKNTNTTEIRIDYVGVIATRGQRTVFLMGRGAAQKAHAMQILNQHSFDKIFKSGKRGVGATRFFQNYRYIHLPA